MRTNIRTLLLLPLLAVILTAELHAEETAATDSIAEGSYVWVPDSLKKDIELLKSGHYRLTHDDSRVDLKETTVYRGDTIPMILRDRNLGRFHRGLYNYLFIPKGTWMFGITASYGEFSTLDLEMFDVLKDINIGAHSFSIRPYLSYFIRNNMSVGVRFSYSNSKAGIESFKVDIDDDMNFNLQDINYDNESYSTAITFRQYIGIARRGRFGVSNEVSLEFASGNSRFRRPYDGNPKETHTTYMDARLNFSPGVCVFVMKNVSFNLSFGVFGFYLRNEQQKVDGIPTGNRLTSGASFRFNIFNIAFGLGVHI